MYYNIHWNIFLALRDNKSRKQAFLKRSARSETAAVNVFARQRLCGRGELSKTLVASFWCCEMSLEWGEQIKETLIEPPRGSSEVLHAHTNPGSSSSLCSLSVFALLLLLLLFFPATWSWGSSTEGPLLSRVELSRRRCEGRCSRRGRWEPAEPQTASCSCGSLLATPAAPCLERTREKEAKRISDVWTI